MRIKLSVKTIMGVGLLHLLVGLPGYARADLVGYWPFDEGQGTVAADVTGGNHGEITGSTWLLPGKMGNAALEFTANGNYVNCGPDVTSGPDITVAFWMKANNLAYCQPLLASAGDYATV
ncbi:MAG: hypothetical protein K9M57_10235, partial [Phycisphaerae bacterium]|nr:hypothetical protein [Phycisphaerae bacterium]